MKQAKTNRVMLSQIASNEDNPRSISVGKFETLVNSILVFPKMLEIRPIVIDETYTALGGNMRRQALERILTLTRAEIENRLTGMKDYDSRSQEEKDALVAGWMAWQQEPVVPTISAEGMTEAERMQFIIKDNLAYGEWDWDKLANEWDCDDLNAWGMDVWTFSNQADTTDADEAAFTKDIKEESEYFNVTLQFPKEYEKRFNEYFHRVGKDDICEMMVRKINESQEEE